MTRGRYKRRVKDGDEQFVKLPYSVLRHAAWRSLSGSAIKVFLELRSRFSGSNNGRLSLSLEEAAELLGLGKATVMRALKELQEHGFIALVRKGEWYGRKASLWRVTDRACKGELPTRDWTDWRPTKAKTKPVSFMEYLREEQRADTAEAEPQKRKAVL